MALSNTVWHFRSVSSDKAILVASNRSRMEICGEWVVNGRVMRGWVSIASK